MMRVRLPFISQVSLYVRCVRGMAVRDGELIALLHRLEDIAGRETSLDKSELFDVLERVECAEERISVSKLLAGILRGARVRDGSVDAMAAVRALVASSIAPLVEAPFDAATVARGLVRLASELQKFQDDSTVVREYIDETRRRVQACIDLTTIDHS
jgi:hypothetical protein